MGHEERGVDAAGGGASPGAVGSGVPRQHIEATVAGIWAKMLGVEVVGLHDNFLLLGGESLLATQVASEIREQLGCDVPIRSIFVSTVAEVAGEIEALLAGSAGGQPAVDGAASATS